MKIGLGLDVCHLSEVPSGERQYIVAVSGSDNSIELFTLESVPKRTFTKFRPYATMRDVHPFTMTKIAFSTFKPPIHLTTSDVRPHYIKLASVSVGNTVVVHTLPLFPYRSSKSRKQRHVVVSPGPSEFVQTLFSGFMALLVVGIGAFFLQAFAEIRGGVPPTLGATDWLSPRLREMIAKPYIFGNGSSGGYHRLSSAASSSCSGPTDIPTLRTPPQLLRDLLSAHDEATISTATATKEPSITETPKMIIVRDDGTEISARTHTDEDGNSPPAARKWEDLTSEEREVWKQKLTKAGHWAFEEGEAILKGVFFGELAGFVRDATVG
jgi:glycyl-tRNA synthetase